MGGKKFPELLPGIFLENIILADCLSCIPVEIDSRLRCGTVGTSCIVISAHNVGYDVPVHSGNVSVYRVLPGQGRARLSVIIAFQISQKVIPALPVFRHTAVGPMPCGIPDIVSGNPETHSDNAFGYPVAGIPAQAGFRKLNSRAYCDRVCSALSKRLCLKHFKMSGLQDIVIASGCGEDCQAA